MDTSNDSAMNTSFMVGLYNDHYFDESHRTGQNASQSVSRQKTSNGNPDDRYIKRYKCVRDLGGYKMTEVDIPVTERR